MPNKFTDADPMDFCGVPCNFTEECIKKAKAEAYKEFFEFIHNELCDISDTQFIQHNISFCANFQIAIDKVREVYKKLVGGTLDG